MGYTTDLLIIIAIACISAGATLLLLFMFRANGDDKPLRQVKTNTPENVRFHPSRFIYQEGSGWFILLREGEAGPFLTETNRDDFLDIFIQMNGRDREAA